MNTIEAIQTRNSIRSFTDQMISQDQIRVLLEAAMAGPSAVNKKPWTFLVVQNKETLEKMADANGSAAQVLKKANLGILVCTDLEQTYQEASDYWIIDGAIACQNMILAAHDMGLGSVWLGTWPQEEKVQGQKELFNLPDTIIPHSIIAFGYPKDNGNNRKVFDESKIHYEKW